MKGKKSEAASSQPNLESSASPADNYIQDSTDLSPHNGQASGSNHPDSCVNQESPQYMVEDEPIKVSPNEELCGEPLTREVVSHETIRIDRGRAGFSSSASFHSSYDKFIRHEAELFPKKRMIRVETVTDILSGKSVRADLSALEPERSKITWAGISLLSCLCIKVEMSFDRMQKLQFSAIAIFSTSSICRYIQQAAQELTLIYFYLSAELTAKAETICGDDSNTRSLEMEAEAASCKVIILS